MVSARSVFVLISFSGLLGSIGCKREPSTPQKDGSKDSKIEPRMQEEEPPVVSFDLKAVADPRLPKNSQLFECSYQARGKTAKFRIELKEGTVNRDVITTVSAEGKFIAVSGSDNSALLRDLKRASDGKHLPTSPVRLPELPFAAVVLGQNESRSPDGAYSDNPRGDWVLVKIFLPKGGDDGEVFLNFNPVLGKGEFSIKDSEYGDYLLKELAKVL